MNKEEKFDDIYMQAESGVFDKLYYELGKGNAIGLDVKEVKKACANHDIDFDEFLKYAQKIKKEENK